MSKSDSKRKVVVSTTPKIKPSTATSKTFSPQEDILIFSKRNYILMLAGIGLIALGLMLMSGGAMPDPNTWDESIIYSTRRTLLAPFVIILGLVVEIFAIFANPKSPEQIDL